MNWQLGVLFAIVFVGVVVLVRRGRSKPGNGGG
jgi:hypothetical protein